MKNIHLSLLAVSALLIASCSEPAVKKEEETTTKEAPTEVTCNYNYDASSTKLSWKAFKTSAKIGVGGTFDTYMVEGTKMATKESEVFSNASFTIVTPTVNSGNTARDPKIVASFFNAMMDSDTISGKVIKMGNPTNGEGAAILSITMNGETHEENAKYTLEGTDLQLSATLDLSKWNADQAVASLNEACEILHTGEDGVSKLWNEVDVEISTTLTKDCE